MWNLGKYRLSNSNFTISITSSLCRGTIKLNLQFKCSVGVCMEKGQYIRYYSFQDIAHSSIKEKSLHISSRAHCPTNAKSLVPVFLQVVKSSRTTAEAQNYLILLYTKQKALLDIPL